MKNNTQTNWLRGSCIGRGAYGTVNAALNLTTGDVFAVKSVDLATASPSHVQALENEIAILSSVSSPFIVKYLGHDTTTEGSPPTSVRNLHMEYLPAGTAADLTDSGEAAVASYAWCLLSALSYLHSRGIVHCDVKGRNVLLGHSPGSAVLADFGSAVYGGTVSPHGSPLWMAPEVIRGEHQGPESDVWSLGCTVIEMLTGKPAWGAAAGSVCRIGYSDELPLFPARLSSSGVDFLEKCLRRDYTRRWSCDQLLQHPFVSMSSHIDITDHWSPRCVLDCFNSDFHEDEEVDVGNDDDEMSNVDGNERIRGLVTAAGANWESDGWLVVRGESDGGGETCSEYPHFVEVEDITSSSSRESSEYHSPTSFLNSNSNSNFETLHDNVNIRHNDSNTNISSSSSKINVACRQLVEKWCDCTTCEFEYQHFHILRNLASIVSRICIFDLVNTPILVVRWAGPSGKSIYPILTVKLG